MKASGPDINRAAAGRIAMEAVAWLPSVLLTRSGVRWEPVDEQSARVHMLVGSEETASVVHVTTDGRLEKVETMRWEVEGLEGPPEYLPSVAETLGEERQFGGYTVPTKIRLTSKVGTPKENTFFEATILLADHQ
jgi:hypothetical protein